MTEVSRLVDAAAGGDRRAANELLPLVYDALRALAAARLAAEPAGQTLQPTALVHEVYLRLVGSNGDGPNWDGHEHFFAAAAEAMRRILVDAARRKQRPKHGADRCRVDLDSVPLAAPVPEDDLVALDEALGRLAAADPQAARLVELRHFAGLSIPEAADVLGVSSRTADRVWAFARAWLHRALSDPPDRQES